mgnify:CR=1 FL=1
MRNTIGLFTCDWDFSACDPLRGFITSGHLGLWGSDFLFTLNLLFYFSTTRVESDAITSSFQHASALNERSGGQCGPESISRLGVICGLSLLVLFSALGGFSPGTTVFPSPQKPTYKL